MFFCYKWELIQWYKKVLMMWGEIMGLCFKMYIYYVVSLVFNYQIFQVVQNEVGFIQVRGIGGYVDCDSVIVGCQFGEEFCWCIFYYCVFFGRQIQLFGVQQIGVWCWFVVFYLFGGDEYFRYWQVCCVVMCVGNWN